MLITRPLFDDRSGRTVGVLAGRLDMATLGQLMARHPGSQGLGQTSETYLVSADNNWLVTPSRFESEGYGLARAYHSAGIDQALQGQTGGGSYLNYRTPPVPVI